MASLWVDAPTPHVPPPLRLINSVEQTSTRPSHGKVMASLSYEPLGVCSLVRRQTPVGHVRAHVTRESHQPVRQQRGYDKWWSTAATPDSTRMTQVSLYIALNNFVPLHCATWLLVSQTGQIHLPHNRWGRQIAQSGLGHGGKYRNIRLIHGSCQAGPGRDRSLFLDSLLADQSMEQSHSRRGGRAAHARSHTPQQSPASHTRGGRQGPGAAQVDWCSHTHHAAGGGRRGATSFFGFLPSGPTRSLDATDPDHRLG